MTAIVDIHAREILDSRGNPTVGVCRPLGVAAITHSGSVFIRARPRG